MSVDYGPSTVFEVHKITMPLKVYHVESAANLTTLPPTGFTVTVAPIDIAGGSGGPARVFAAALTARVSPARVKTQPPP